MSEEQLELGAAVKTLYKTQPLDRDLATAVATRAFAPARRTSTIWDKAIYIAFGLIVLLSTLYGASFIGGVSVAAVMLFVAALAGLVGLSVKEHVILLERLGTNNRRRHA